VSICIESAQYYSNMHLLKLAVRCGLQIYPQILAFGFFI
jgi:hypothetical protein